jgi:uncharacterized pyridoxamine 5'-phosphate oxidase family protein
MNTAADVTTIRMYISSLTVSYFNTFKKKTGFSKFRDDGDVTAETCSKDGTFIIVLCMECAYVGFVNKSY